MADQREAAVSPLLDALYRGQEDEVEALLAEDPELDVFEAAALGRTRRLEDLLQSDPGRVNAWSADGFMPIHLASFFGHAAAVELLVRGGADLQAVSRHAQIQVTPLHSAVADEGAADARTVQVLLEHGASPNAGAELLGGTPLHSAAANGDVELVRLLLEHAADPQTRRQDGKTPLDLARKAGHDEVAGLLARAGRSAQANR
jgi:ankyrin repeat protein